MLLIFGLGNPGKKYEKTRHNAGFWLLDKIKEQNDFPDFKFFKKFNSAISEKSLLFENRDLKIFLIKPQTFMNESGLSVRSILDFYKIPLENILIIHDDLDIPFGQIKTASNSRSAGHNGVQDIIEKLGTQNFKRIRIGIGRPDRENSSPALSSRDYVLEKFSPKEILELEKESKKIIEYVWKEIKKALH